jgi:hypothetical protein
LRPNETDSDAATSAPAATEAADAEGFTRLLAGEGDGTACSAADASDNCSPAPPSDDETVAPPDARTTLRAEECFGATDFEDEFAAGKSELVAGSAGSLAAVSTALSAGSLAAEPAVPPADSPPDEGLDEADGAEPPSESGAANAAGALDTNVAIPNAAANAPTRPTYLP